MYFWQKHPSKAHPSSPCPGNLTSVTWCNSTCNCLAAHSVAAHRAGGGEGGVAGESLWGRLRTLSFVLLLQLYLSDPVQQRSQPAEQHTVSHQPSLAVLVPPNMAKART